MKTRVRWYNRLAAWLYEHNSVGDLLMELAIPAWQEQADAEIEEMWDEEHERQENLSLAYNDGYYDGLRAADLDDSEPPF